MKLDKVTARAMCVAHDIPYGPERPDFHALSNSIVDDIVAAADSIGYRKPKNANASRACYFYGHLGRVIAKPE